MTRRANETCAHAGTSLPCIPRKIVPWKRKNTNGKAHLSARKRGMRVEGGGLALVVGFRERRMGGGHRKLHQHQAWPRAWGTHKPASPSHTHTNKGSKKENVSWQKRPKDIDRGPCAPAEKDRTPLGFRIRGVLGGAWVCLSSPSKRHHQQASGETAVASRVSLHASILKIWPPAHSIHTSKAEKVHPQPNKRTIHRHKHKRRLQSFFSAGRGSLLVLVSSLSRPPQGKHHRK